eukprot:625202-Hanusia_phi.AAC.2
MMQREDGEERLRGRERGNGEKEEGGGRKAGRGCRGRGCGKKDRGEGKMVSEKERGEEEGGGCGALT